MGRAGGGGRVGGSGGGHHSVSHSGGGHRASFGGSSRAGSSSHTSRSSGSSFGGSSRAGSSSHTSRSSGSSFGGFSSNRSSGPSVYSSRGYTPPIIVNNKNGGGLFGRSFGGMGCGGCVTGVVVLVIIIVIFALMMSMMSAPAANVGSVEVPASSYNREKLEDTSWTNDCVVDELGWIEEDGSISSLERKLREFYDKTGVQPYVYLVDYRDDLYTDADKEAFASQYYEYEIGNDYTFAFFYFGEYDPDDVGYMYYEGGARALGVMDSEAVDIFWAICDQEWYGSGTTEDVLANMFNRTADRIMTKSRTAADNWKIVLIIVLVIVVAAVIIIIMNKRRKQEKERNEETRRILETPLE